MDPQSLILLSNVYARRMAAAWPSAAAVWPQRTEPMADDGLISLWAEFAQVPEALAEEHARRLLQVGICVRETGQLDETAKEMMDRLTPLEIASAVVTQSARRGRR